MRKGNPKEIHDWDDLAKPGVAVITPNPKTSGGARWNYLAAWGYALRKVGNDPAKAKDFVGRIYKNVPVLDTGARGSTITFVQRGIGDVLLAWENEALPRGRRSSAPDKFEIVAPVDQHPGRAAGRGGRQGGRPSTGRAQVAKAYLIPLHARGAGDRGQALLPAAQRRRSPPSTRRSSRRCSCSPSIEVFGGWTKAQQTHFADGGVFDQIYEPDGE